MRSLPEVYATDAPRGDEQCGHPRARLASDVTVAGGIGPWYVECPECGAVGPPAQHADDTRGEIVGMLTLWETARAGEPEARELVRAALADIRAAAL